MGLADRIKGWAKALKRDVVAVWIAARDPRTPLSARIVAALVAAYALSPIDLIPDVIPVLGLLDDLLLVPLGLLLAIRLIPGALLAEFRHRAETVARRPTSRSAALVIVVLWTVVALWLGWTLLR
jgi:uncharacterized membrane protein YkvA (DUF1232 family)